VASDPTLLIGPLSPSARGPLYLQIINALRREVSEGRLPAGTALPSFRRLAEDLLVSGITVRRAYEELEREGIIFRRQGVGTFVSNVAPDRSRAAKLERARELFREGVREAAEAGLPPRAIGQLAQTAVSEHLDPQPDSGEPTNVRKRA
jgi:GntR family transcriptional regulator